MLERSIPILRLVCLGLAALILVQCSRLALSKDPAAGLRIPPVPASLTQTGSTSAAGNPSSPLVKDPHLKSARSNTNAAPAKSGAKPASAPPNSQAMAAGTSSTANPGRPPGNAPTDLAPAVKSYLDRIIQSEILGPVPRPMPMALLGIAGKDAFLRGPDGQTGLVREGDTLGSLKLLRIGTNRVLVEQEGQRQELTIFSGLGSETLLPQGKEKLP